MTIQGMCFLSRSMKMLKSGLSCLKSKIDTVKIQTYKRFKRMLFIRIKVLNHNMQVFVIIPFIKL